MRRSPPIAALALALVAWLAAACPGDGEATLPRGRVTIQGRTIEVDVARTGADRARGLSGRNELAAGRGMLFLHDAPGRHAYWMKDMRFAIDILWLRDGRVVDVAHRVPPPPAGLPDGALPVYAPAADADAVLEVSAGFARIHGWDKGAQARLELPPR